VEKLNRVEDSDEGVDEADELTRALRTRRSGRVMGRIKDILEDVLIARSDEDRARLVEFRCREKAPSEAARMAHKIVALRRQVVWAKTAELARAVCELLDESAGFEAMSADEAGVGVDEDSRALVELLTKTGAARRGRAAR